MIELLLFLAFLGLIIGTYTDFKIREVPDWLSYSLIVAGLGLRLLYSAITFDWMFFIYGLLGFGIFLALALLMYYGGQWGGGDSKVLMGIGALLGFEPNPFSFFIGFFINLLIIGALYGIGWSIFLAIKNKKNFKKEFMSLQRKKRRLNLALFVLLLIFIILVFLLITDSFLKIILIIFSIFFYLSLYVYIFTKSVENSSMYKMYPVNKLTEGDWIAKIIRYKGKYLCGPKDLGISKKQIALLKKFKIKQVLVKEGIPFIPSFLIAFIITYIFGNLLFLLL